MSFYNSCPVCSFPASRGERQCPRCGWELESAPILGRLTLEVKSAYEKHLEQARARWALSQQRITAQRSLVAAQAKLQRIQRVCLQARPESTGARPASAPSPAFSPVPADSPTPEPSRVPPRSSWNPLHWLRLYWGSSLSDFLPPSDQQDRCA